MKQKRIEKNPTDAHVGGRIRMRRMMLKMSQEKLGDALGITFQQIQKYEKGTNRVGASRLQHISQVLQVPVAFFFEGMILPESASKDSSGTTAPLQEIGGINQLMATRDGLALAKAFMKISNIQLRKRIAALAEEIVDHQR
jgi:transcriptional regulator with XRE-family HTH domain